MMKGLTIGLLLLGGVVAVFQPNNNLIEDSVLEEEKLDTLTRKEFVENLDKLLIGEIKKCLSKNDPQIFMTKCYSNVEPTIYGKKLNDYDQVLFKNYAIRGAIVFTECGQPHHLCSYRYFPDKDSLVVRESFTRPWQQSTDFTKSFCKSFDKK